jgi:Excinuclease ATPase subunit
VISSKAFIELKNVYTNNLKGFSVKIPLKALTVIVGPSGSGKSSLAFDTLAKIGLQRLKHLLNYSFPILAEEGIKAEVSGAIPPVIALAQGVRDWYPYKLVGELLGLYSFLNNLVYARGGILLFRL